MGLEDARKIEQVFQTATKWTNHLMLFCRNFKLKIMRKKPELKTITLVYKSFKQLIMK